MSGEEYGYFKISRKLTGSDLWLSEPFTRGQAWVDLIGLANYHDNEITVNGSRVMVRRGQCAWSELRLAQRWQWGREKVHKFILQLKCMGNIERVSSNRISMISIVNYEAYQEVNHKHQATEQASDQATEQASDQAHTIKEKEKRNKNKEKKYIQKKENSPDSESQLPLLDGNLPEEPKPDESQVAFQDFWKLFPKTRVGSMEKAQAAFRRACERDLPANIIAGTVRYAVSEEVKRGFAKGAAAWLNDDRWRSDYTITPQLGAAALPKPNPNKRAGARTV